jgi:hypothetical protein
MRDEVLEAVINAIPRQAQRQYDSQTQLLYLMEAANRLGLYDAADMVRNLLSSVRNG